jgi:predicted enzyme related to lactoylglutathione lyase
MSDVRETDAPATGSGSGSGPNPAGDFIWYELMTTDADGAKTFYDAVAGFDIGEGAAEYQGYRMINSGGGFAGGLLPLTEEMQQGGARPTWLGYLYVPDVDQAVTKIEAAGGKTQMPATDIPNVGRIAMVGDPQGAPIYVMKPIPPAGQENAQSDVFSPDKVGRIAWNELNTSDPAAARKFYGDHFGWGTDDFMDMGEMGEYRFIDHHGKRLGALCGVMPGGHPKWRYYIRVPSIAAAKATAEAKGGTVHMGPHQVPTGDWIIIGTDPQGAEFALVGGE